MRETLNTDVWIIIALGLFTCNHFCPKRKKTIHLEILIIIIISPISLSHRLADDYPLRCQNKHSPHQQVCHQQAEVSLSAIGQR